MADAKPAQRDKPKEVKLFHVPHLAHRLTLAVRAQPAARVRVTVRALPPGNWQQPAVKAVMGQQPPALTEPTVAAEKVVDATGDWQEVTLEIPKPDKAIEGYNLELRLVEPADAVYWYDSVEFSSVAPGR